MATHRAPAYDDDADTPVAGDVLVSNGTTWDLAQSGGATLTTRGDLLTRNATVLSRLPVGGANTVLTSDGTDVSWAAAGGGKVLQVVQAEKTTALSTTSTSYADSTFGVTITPASTSNKVLVFAFVHLGHSASNTGYIQIRRGSTDLDSALSAGRADTDSTFNLRHVGTGSFDSPSTASAVTYKLYWKTDTGTLYMNRNGFSSTVTGLSRMIAVEVAA